MQVVIGRIGRAHGIRGEVSVEIRTDEPERRFAPSSVLFCGDRVLTVRASRHHSGRLLVTFDEVADRTAAEQLGGEVLEAEVDPSELPEDPEEFYDHQLVDLQVRTADGTLIGSVTAVVHLPEQDTLVVDAGGREVLVPFVTEHVPVVDLEAGFVRIGDAPGLLDPDDAVTVETSDGDPS